MIHSFLVPWYLGLLYRSNTKKTCLLLFVFYKYANCLFTVIWMLQCLCVNLFLWEKFLIWKKKEPNLIKSLKRKMTNLCFCFWIHVVIKKFPQTHEALENVQSGRLFSCWVVKNDLCKYVTCVGKNHSSFLTWFFFLYYLAFILKYVRLCHKVWVSHQSCLIKYAAHLMRHHPKNWWDYLHSAKFSLIPITSLFPGNSQGNYKASVKLGHDVQWETSTDV